MPKTAIKALAPWYGSKRTLAPRIVAALGEHTAYYEPFCGSMAVLFAKPEARHEVVNDLNGDLTNIAWVLQERKLRARLLSRLHDTLASEMHFRSCRSRWMQPFNADPAKPDVRRAYDALVTWWLGRNGMAGTKKGETNFSARYTSHGGSGGVRFRNMVESVPAFIDRLARVDVLNRDGFEIIGKVDDSPGTAIYLDPPYLKKSAPYEHDFATADHDRLAVALSRFHRSRVVVSYYDHPRLAELYPASAWDIERIEVVKNIANSNSRAAGSTKAVEVLIRNRPAAGGAN